MRLATITVLIALLAGCGSGGSAPGQTTFSFDFGQGAQGWTTGFSDYPVGQEQFFQLDSGLRTLPPPLDQNSKGVLLSGINHSDDLFMFLTGRLTGLRPDRKYRFRFLVEFATNAPSGCISIGGSPGESVVVKVGASPTEPQPKAVAGGYIMNIDKGNQSQDGTDAIVVGNVANGLTDCGNPVYTMKTLQNTQGTFTAKTDSQGTMWAIVGSDSGFEGETALYYTKIVVTVEPS
jgi:hypothetical protein